MDKFVMSMDQIIKIRIKKAMRRAFVRRRLTDLSKEKIKLLLQSEFIKIFTKKKYINKAVIWARMAIAFRQHFVKRKRRPTD